MAAPPPEDLPSGTRIRVHGLAARPEFNGQSGTAISWDGEKGRVGIKLDSGDKLSLKPANLERLESDAAAPPATSNRKAYVAKEKSMFSNMFSKPGALSEKEVDIVWKGERLPRVFFDIEVDGRPMGRVVIELWPDKTPKSCENFRALCTGERGVSKSSRKRLCYRGSSFLRVMEGMALFGGDTTKGNGKGGESIFGADYEDLSCSAEGAPTHDRPGLVSMGWPGDKPPGDPEDQDPNKRTHLGFGSRFSIFLEPEPHFNGRLPVVRALDASCR